MITSTGAATSGPVSTAPRNPAAIDSRLAAWFLRWRVAVLLAAGVLVLFYAALLVHAAPTVRRGSSVFLRYTLDDSYMYLRYAGNMLRGKGIAWNPDGIQTYGVTSLPYLLVVTALTPLRLEGGLLLMLVSWAFAVLFFVAVAFTCARAVHSTTLKSLPLMLVFAAGPAMLPVISHAHALTGLDTTLSAFCNALMIACVMVFISRPNRARFVLMCLGAYVSYAARPDNALYAILFPAIAIVWLTSERSTVWKFLLAMSGLVALDLSIKYAIFGYALPLSSHVKTAGYYDGFAGAGAWNPITYLREFGLLVLPYLWILILFARRKHGRLLTAFLLPVTVTFAYYFTVIQIMGVHARFYYPSLAFWIVPAMLVLDDVVRDRSLVVDSKAMARRAIVGALLSLGVWGLTPPLAKVYAATVIGKPPKIGHGPRILPQLGGWLTKKEMAAVASQFPAGTTMALTEVGFVGAEAPQVTLIDLAGLNDNHLAHAGFSMQYLIERSPDFIWFPHWNYVDIVNTILEDAAFQAQYDYYCDAYDFGIAMKKDSRFRQPIEDALRRNWTAAYNGQPMRTCNPQASR